MLKFIIIVLVLILSANSLYIENEAASTHDKLVWDYSGLPCKKSLECKFRHGVNSYCKKSLFSSKGVCAPVGK